MADLSPAQQSGFKKWLKDQSPKPIDTAMLRQRVEQSLAEARMMPTEEYTLWRTWQQVQEEFDPSDKARIRRIRATKRNIWIPNSPDDVEALQPELVFAQQTFPIPNVSIWGTERIAFMSNPDPISQDWEHMRHFVASMEHGGSIGRGLRFVVRDKGTKKYLGILCLASDFATLAPRDEAIGWKNGIHTGDGPNMLNHSAVGSVIIPTQPFGYSFVGGKLMAMLLASDVVARTWERVYGNILVGVTTTSLYGHEKGGSQYSGLSPVWKSYGHTEGSAGLRPDNETLQLMRDWLLAEFPEVYWQYYVATREDGMPLFRSHNERARQFCFKQLGFSSSDYTSNHQRGIYYCHLYKNSFEFLRQEVTEDQLDPRFDNSVEALVEMWRSKHARKRVAKLVGEDRFSYVTHFTDEMIGMPWEDAKKRYLR
jgi:hypothetical protein